MWVYYKVQLSLILRGIQRDDAMLCYFSKNGEGKHREGTSMSLKQKVETCVTPFHNEMPYSQWGNNTDFEKNAAVPLLRLCVKSPLKISRS